MRAQVTKTMVPIAVPIQNNADTGPHRPAFSAGIVLWIRDNTRRFLSLPNAPIMIRNGVDTVERTIYHVTGSPDGKAKAGGKSLKHTANGRNERLDSKADCGWAARLNKKVSYAVAGEGDSS